MIAFVAVALICSTTATALTPTAAQLAHLQSSLREVRSRQKFVHVVELGCTSTAAQTAGHQSVASWSILCHDPELARKLLEQHNGSDSVTVQLIEGDFASWGRADAGLQFFDGTHGGGTLAEFENLVAELKFFGAKDKNEYWILVFGVAQADAAISALPLLASRGGRLVVADWEPCVQDTILFFYQEESAVAALHVLEPKTITRAPSGSILYPWCFNWPGGARVTLRDGPADTEGSMARVSELVPCSSFAGAFKCDTGADGAYSGDCKPCTRSDDGCIPCEVAMLAVTRRGFAVTHSLDKLQALQPQPQSQSQMKHAEL